MGAPDPYPASVCSARSRGDEDEGGPQRVVPVWIRTEVQTLPRPCRAPNIMQHTQPVMRYLIGPPYVALTLVGEACPLRGSCRRVRLEIVAGGSQIVDERVG